MAEVNFISRALAAGMRGENKFGIISAAINTDAYQEREKQRIEYEQYLAEQRVFQRRNNAYVEEQRRLDEPVQKAQREADLSRSRLNKELADRQYKSLDADEAYRQKQQDAQSQMTDMRVSEAKQQYKDSFVARRRKSFSDRVSTDQRVRNLTDAEYNDLKNSQVYKDNEKFHVLGGAMLAYRNGDSNALDIVKDGLAEFDIKYEEKDGHPYVTLPGESDPIQVDTPEGEAIIQELMNNSQSDMNELFDVYSKTSFNNTNGFAPGRILADRTAEFQKIVGGDRVTAFKRVNAIMQTFSGREVRAMCLNQALKKAGEDGNYTSEEMQGMFPFFQQDGWEFKGDPTNSSTFRFRNPSMGIDHEIGINELQQILEKNDRITPAFEEEKRHLEAQQQALIAKQSSNVIQNIKKDIGGEEEGGNDSDPRLSRNSGDVFADKKTSDIYQSKFGKDAIAFSARKLVNVDDELTAKAKALGIIGEDGSYHLKDLNQLEQLVSIEEDLLSKNKMDNLHHQYKYMYDIVKIVDEMNKLKKGGFDTKTATERIKDHEAAMYSRKKPRKGTRTPNHFAAMDKIASKMKEYQSLEKELSKYPVEDVDMIRKAMR